VFSLCFSSKQSTESLLIREYVFSSSTADSGNNIQNAKNLLRLLLTYVSILCRDENLLLVVKKMSYQTQKGCFIIWQAVSLKEYLAKTTLTYQYANLFVSEKIKYIQE
jgi:hypothetical protein